MQAHEPACKLLGTPWNLQTLKPMGNLMKRWNWQNFNFITERQILGLVELRLSS